MPLKELLQEDRRLVLLRSLYDLGHNGNESTLHQCLDAYGHTVSRDTVRTEMAWLAEQGLLNLKEMPGCLVAELTGRGEDVALGRTTVPGVKRPRPGERP